MSFQLPTEIGMPLIDKKAQQLQQQENELRKDSDRLDRLNRQRSDVQDADETAVAEALAAGKDEPEPQALRDHDEQVTALERRIAGRDRAIATLRSDLRVLVDSHRSKLEENYAAQLGDARERMTAAISVLEEAHAAAADGAARLAWLRGMPNEARFAPGNYLTQVTGLQSKSGYDYGFGVVITALIDHAVGKPAVAPPVAPWGIPNHAPTAGTFDLRQRDGARRLANQLAAAMPGDAA